MSLRFEYRPLEDVGLPLRERLGLYPRVPDLTLDALRTLARWSAVAFTRLQFRIDVIGRFPDLDRAALVANHQSHLDTLVVLAALPERRRRSMAVLAAKDYFFERWETALGASLFAMAVSFDRTQYTELRRWARLLRRQERGWLLVYPSGSRRRAEAHDAILFVLAKSGWPMVPVAISGTAAAWPVGRAVWHPFRRLRVTVGEPLGLGPTRSLGESLATFWREHV